MLQNSEAARCSCDQERLEALRQSTAILLTITPWLNLVEFASPATAI